MTRLGTSIKQSPCLPYSIQSTSLFFQLLPDYFNFPLWLELFTTALSIKMTVVKQLPFFLATQRVTDASLMSWNVKKSESMLKIVGKAPWSLPNHEQASFSLDLTGLCKLLLSCIQLLGMCMHVRMCPLTDSLLVMDAWLWIFEPSAVTTHPAALPQRDSFPILFSPLTHFFPSFCLLDFMLFVFN